MLAKNSLNVSTSAQAMIRKLVRLVIDSTTCGARGWQAVATVLIATDSAAAVGAGGVPRLPVRRQVLQRQDLGDPGLLWHHDGKTTESHRARSPVTGSLR
jgi:hypothetical protein